MTSTCEQPAQRDPAIKWWWRRQFRYNAGLAVAVLLSAALWATLGIDKSDPSWFSGFAVFLVLSPAILLMMVIANVLYFVGPLSEWVFQPTDTDRFRRIAFALVFWFSVPVPFAIPVLLGYLISGSGLH